MRAVASRAKTSRAEKRRRYERGTLEFDRVAFFSDAVFAIAMTLLVVGIAVPEVQAAELRKALVDLEPQILSFFISFAVIGMYWRGHHRLFAELRAVDDTFILVNLGFLAVIAFLPFPTALMGDYGGEAVAFVIYALTLAAASTASVLLHRLVDARALRREERTAVGRRHNLLAGLAPIAVFVLSIPLALATSPSVGLWSWVSIVVLEMLINRTWPEDDPPLASVDADD